MGCLWPEDRSPAGALSGREFILYNNSDSIPPMFLLHEHSTQVAGRSRVSFSSCSADFYVSQVVVSNPVAHPFTGEAVASSCSYGGVCSGRSLDRSHTRLCSGGLPRRALFASTPNLPDRHAPPNTASQPAPCARPFDLSENPVLLSSCLLGTDV